MSASPVYCKEFDLFHVLSIANIFAGEESSWHWTIVEHSNSIARHVWGFILQPNSIQTTLTHLGWHSLLLRSKLKEKGGEGGWSLINHFEGESLHQEITLQSCLQKFGHNECNNWANVEFTACQVFCKSRLVQGKYWESHLCNNCDRYILTFAPWLVFHDICRSEIQGEFTHSYHFYADSSLHCCLT